MNNMINYISNHKSYHIKYIKNNYLTQEVKDVLSKYNLTLHELCYRIKNNIPFNKLFTCKYCNKKVHFTTKHHYRKFCSVKCQVTYFWKQNITRQNRIQNSINKYGVAYPTQTKECKNKVKQTCLNKYGETTNLKTKECQNKIKQTCLSKYGVDSPLKSKNIQEKIKQTCIKKYGVDRYTKAKECKDKIKQTCINKYGVTSYSKTKECRDKMKQTCIERYGVDNYSKTKEFKDKARQTCLGKYGVDNYSKTQKFKNFVKENKDKIQNKKYFTMRINNSYGKSNPEEKVYQLLLTKFTKEDIERQYKSDLYPFACDFYIKSLNLYIEYNGTWTHGWYHHKCLGSYDKNNSEHQKILKLYKKKNTNYYNTAIYVWTILDVKKLETFKKNNLNYKIFWTVNEVENWLKEI